MDWAATLLGLDEKFHIRSGVGGGAIQGTASDSALVAGVAARIRFLVSHPDISSEKLVLYVSSQTHSLGVKTALLLGLTCRTLPVLAEDDYSLRGSTLKAAYEEDRAAGLWPFCLSMYRITRGLLQRILIPSIQIVATVGTTSSGAVDRLDELGPIGELSFPCRGF